MQPLILTTAEITAWVGAFVWPLLRVSAMLMVMPAIGGRNVPLRIRAALAVMLTVVMLPQTGAAPALDPLSADGLLVSIHQVLIGAFMGLMLQLVLQAAIIAGEFVALSMGLGFALMADPQNGVQVPMVGQLFMILATLLFLVLNGHLALIQMVADSFSYLPLGGGGLPFEAYWLLVEWSATMFTGAMSIALPAVISLLAVNLSLGVITRAAPQLNIFSVGFPLTLLTGLVILMSVLPTLPEVFESLMEQAFVNLNNWLRGRF
ncbi:MAG: flagellar biosynthetic protein FliR [Thiotrichales bacterium]